jgi:hypothetical protein
VPNVVQTAGLVDAHLDDGHARPVVEMNAW